MLQIVDIYPFRVILKLLFKNMKTYLSSYNSISPIEVFTVHMHRASFALSNTSSSTCKLKKDKTMRKKDTPLISFK